MHSKRIPTVIAALAAIMSIRMLGLFMILPVFSVYAETIRGATATLIGLTLGIYGLTQALLQIPFGMLSDRIGRKPVIIVGLGFLLFGSMIAACAHSIYFLMLGRALQGAGAIGSTVLALVADLTRDSSRGKAMAIIGLAIACAFTVAMIAGPVLNHWLHLSGIFWITGLLAGVGIALLGLVPTPPKPLKIARLSAPTKLWRLNIGIGALHAILTALFIAIPLVLTHTLGLSSEAQIIAYFCVLFAAFACALPLISFAERKRQLKTLFIIAVFIVLAVQLGFLFLHRSVGVTIACLFIFFTAFTFLEASLPSMVSKMAPVTSKGAAMGVYSSCQFFGIFVGGLLGGLAFSRHGLTGIFAFTAIVAFAWLLITPRMPKPSYLTTMAFPRKYGEYAHLATLPGVAEIAIAEVENLLYVKFDKQKITIPELRNAVEAGTLVES